MRTDDEYNPLVVLGPLAYRHGQPFTADSHRLTFHPYAQEAAAKSVDVLPRKNVIGYVINKYIEYVDHDVQNETMLHVSVLNESAGLMPQHRPDIDARLAGRVAIANLVTLLDIGPPHIPASITFEYNLLSNGDVELETAEARTDPIDTRPVDDFLDTFDAVGIRQPYEPITDLHAPDNLVVRQHTISSMAKVALTNHVVKLTSHDSEFV